MAAKKYKKITRTIGHRVENGVEVAVKKQFYGATKKECLEKYQAFMMKSNLGIETEKQYFGILADNWIYNFLVNDYTLKDSTRKLYVNTWNKYIKPTDLYHLPLDKITPAVLQKTYNSLDCPPTPMKTIHKVMRRFFRYLAREGYSRDLTVSLVLPIREKKLEENEIVVWTDEEIRKIFGGFEEAQAGFRLRFFIVLAYYTGCRLSEILALRYEDFTDNGIRINKQVVNVPTFIKGKKTTYEIGIDTPKSNSSIRTMPLNDEIKEELEIHRKWHMEEQMRLGYRTKYVFTTTKGTLYEGTNVRTALNRYYKRIGVPTKTPHVYRHTFGTSLCRNGVRIEVASILLGHTDIRITAKYYVGVTYNEKLDAVDCLSKCIKSS